MRLEFPTTHDICLRHKFAIHHQIEREGVLGLGLEELYVDLAGGSFIAVDDRGSTFADLNRLHPWSGNILQAEVLRQTTHGGRILLD